MDSLPFVPRLNNFSIGIADDVWTSETISLPINQRLATHLPYTASVSLLLNGTDHDELLGFWKEHQTAFIRVKMMLEDSQLRWYECLFVGAPIITPKSGFHTSWTTEQILKSKADVEHCYFESRWQFVAYVRHRTKQDEQTLADYEYITDDPFVGFVVRS